MDLPGINGLSATVELLNGWFSGMTFDLGSSFLNEWEINGPLVSLARAVAATKGWTA